MYRDELKASMNKFEIDGLRSDENRTELGSRCNEGAKRAEEIRGVNLKRMRREKRSIVKGRDHYSCAICGRKCGSAAELAAHLAIHSHGRNRQDPQQQQQQRRHGRLPLRGAQDSSSRTSKCLPILSHYRRPDAQEVNLIEYLKKVKLGWWET